MNMTPILRIIVVDNGGGRPNAKPLPYAGWQDAVVAANKPGTTLLVQAWEPKLKGWENMVRIS